MKSLLRSVFLIALVWLLSACAALQQSVDTYAAAEALKRCRFQVVSLEPNIRISEFVITSKGIQKPKIFIDLDTNLAITNTTGQHIRFNRADLVFQLDGNPLAKLGINQNISIKAGEKKVIPALFSLNAETASRELAQKLRRGNFNYKVLASIYFDLGGNIILPVEVEMYASEG